MTTADDTTLRRAALARAARDMILKIRVMIEENLTVLGDTEQLIDAGQAPESLRVRIEAYRGELEQLEDLLEGYEQGQLDTTAYAKLADRLGLTASGLMSAPLSNKPNQNQTILGDSPCCQRET